VEDAGLELRWAGNRHPASQRKKVGKNFRVSLLDFLHSTSLSKKRIVQGQFCSAPHTTYRNARIGEDLPIRGVGDRLRVRTLRLAGTFDKVLTYCLEKLCTQHDAEISGGEVDR